MVFGEERLGDDGVNGGDGRDYADGCALFYLILRGGQYRRPTLRHADLTAQTCLLCF
jgi:hypothetical protein